MEEYEAAQELVLHDEKKARIKYSHDGTSAEERLASNRFKTTYVALRSSTCTGEGVRSAKAARLNRSRSPIIIIIGRA
jgi:hypothetical protein